MGKRQKWKWMCKTLSADEIGYVQCTHKKMRVFCYSMCYWNKEEKIKQKQKKGTKESSKGRTSTNK